MLRYLKLKKETIYEAIWTKIELNALAVYDDRYIKTKIRAYGDKVN